jgi:hypothetical protein
LFNPADGRVEKLDVDDTDPLHKAFTIPDNSAIHFNVG